MKQRTKVLLLSFFISFNLLSFESLLFIKEFCLHPTEVGAIAATSSFTGKELCHYISQDPDREGLRILEIGAGCGNVTKIISEQMLPQDHLDSVEINAKLCEKIHEHIGSPSNVSVECCSILDWSPSYKYDMIISTLPFNSFSFGFFKDVFQHISTLGTQDVVFSYVEYMGFGKLKSIFSFDENVKKIKLFLKQLHRDKAVRIENIWLNVPPLKVYHLKINE